MGGVGWLRLNILILLSIEILFFYLKIIRRVDIQFAPGGFRRGMVQQSILCILLCSKNVRSPPRVYGLPLLISSINSRDKVGLRWSHPGVSLSLSADLRIKTCKGDQLCGEKINNFYNEPGKSYYKNSARSLSSTVMQCRANPFFSEPQAHKPYKKVTIFIQFLRNP